jgi:uncharacterized protein
MECGSMAAALSMETQVNLAFLRPASLAIVALLILTLAVACAPAPRATPLPASATPVPTATAAAQPSSSVAGHWEGSVAVAGQNIITRVDLATEDETLKGTVDFPQQNALGLPLQQASQRGNNVHFEVLPAPRTAIFDGQMTGADKIEGAFSQGGITGAFTLTRKEVATPEAVPYREEEVKFANGDVTLAGTLTLPEGAGPHPAVVLISGSGPENRDEEIFGFKVFGVLADHLTRNGIAVLRYDDRGVGGSSAGTGADTSETYAGDVAAAVQYLKGRPEVNPKQIGLLGHSEGGIIAPLVAVSSPDVSYIILMSGSGVPGSRMIQEQGRLINEASGLSPDEVKRKAELQKRVVDAALTGQGWDAVRTEILAEFKKAAEAMPGEQRKALGDIDTWAAKSVDAQIAAFQSPWMQFFLTHDPAAVLEKVKVPVLALFGGLDLQVPAEENRAAIVKALEKAGNKDVTVKVFPDANHLYQKAVTGSPFEYANLPPEFTPGFLETVSDWILAQTRTTK